MNEGSNDLDKKLSGILSDPKAMASIMNIVKNLSTNNPQSNNMNNLHESNAIDVFAPSFDESIAPVGNLSKSYGDKNEFDNRSIGLLLAIKPFLSHDRAQKLDMITQILKVVSLTEIFKWLRW